jgi:hypothetical protein
MKNFFYSLALLIVLGSVFIYSQVNSNYDGPKPEVVAGAKSFVFQYTPFQSNLEPIYVGTISIPGNELSSIDLFGAGFRYFITNQIALGLGVNFGSTSSTLESEAGKNETSATTFGIAIDANYHLMSLYGISPYAGVNINYGTFSGSIENTPIGEATTKTEYSGNGLGAAAQFGFDWYFTEGLSLGGKYALGFRSLGEPETTSDGETVKGSSSTSFGISTFSVILNVHF